VTHQAILRVSESDRMADAGNATGRIFAQLFRFFARFHAERYGWDGSPVHDAVAVAHLLGLGLVETRAYHVEVETASELTRGRTVVDREGLTGRPANVRVGVAIDRERFVALLLEAVASFP
jgi:inosine-uridine nucleoside N-ribohydrolase